MALLGEEVVEEWLNRQGYFTIRGIKLGVHEVDLLAFKPNAKGKHDCRQIEVQVSTNPVAYITKVPKAIQRKRGIGPDNAKERTKEELERGARECIEKKFDHPKKAELRRRLFPGQWSRELVVNEVKHPVELELLRQAGVKILKFKDLVSDLRTGSTIIEAAAGNDLMILMQLGSR